MALTLLDVQRQKTDKFEAGVIETFRLAADLTRVLPIETIGTLEKSRELTESATTLGWRSRGELYGEVLGGDKSERSEQVFAMGATIRIDKQDMRDKRAAGLLSQRTERAVKAAAWTFNTAIIRGDHATDEGAPEGLNVRLALAASTQTIYGVNGYTDRWLDARPYQLVTTADGAAAQISNAKVLLEKLDEAKDACDGGTADVCLTTRRNIRAIKAALRTLGLSKDNLDVLEPINPNDQRRTSAMEWNKPIWQYDGVKYFDMGLQSDQSTAVIATETFAKDSAGSSSSQTMDPYYFVKLGDPYFHVIQQYSLEVSKPEKLPGGVTWETVVDWPVGFAHFHPRGFSKLTAVRTA